MAMLASGFISSGGAHMSRGREALFRCAQWGFLLAAASWAIGLWAAQAFGTTPYLPGRSPAGGLKAAPSFVAADKTPFGVSVSMQGLRPSACYAAKLRLRSSQSSQFGATWNPATRKWCAVASAWSSQPTLTAGPDGGISAWLVARAGSKSAPAPEGRTTATVILREQEATTNIDAPAEASVTVLATGDEGCAGWLHGGGATVPGAGQPILARDEALELVGAATAEPNGVDDDDNGLVDDEAPRDAAQGAWFRLAVPSRRLLELAGWRNQVAFAGLDLLVPREGQAKRLSLAARPPIVRYRDLLVLGMRLDVTNEETLTVQRRDDDVWMPLRTVAVDASAAALVSFPATRSTEYRAVWLGTATCPPSVSRRIVVPVTPRMTAKLSRRRARVGDVAHVFGRFWPAARVRPLHAVLLSAGNRRRDRTIRVLARRGKYACAIRCWRRGRWRVVVVFRGEQELAARWLDAGTITVTGGTR